DEDGQVLDAESISAGLDYPGVGPEHAFLRDSGRAEYVDASDEEALAAFRRLAHTEGVLPALEPAHALARVEELEERLVLVCLSGRGDKDLAEVTARCARRSGRTRSALPLSLTTTANRSGRASRMGAPRRRASTSTST